MYSITTAGSEQLTNNIYKLQADILAEKTSNNTAYLKPSTIKSKNYQLNTTQKAVITAINELVSTIDTLDKQTNTALDEMYSALGNTGADPALLTKLKEQGNSVIEILLDVKSRLEKIEPLALDDYEDVFIIKDTETRTEFPLTYKPLGKIHFHIQGLRYFRDCYTYNSDTNTVVWTNTADNDGFDLTDCVVVIEYDYDRKAE